MLHPVATHTPAAMKDPRELRKTLAQYATGVTVITCSSADGHPCGITANSFSSVSLEPPLVLWNIGKASRSLNAYLQAQYFSIHVLFRDQEDIARHFARSDVIPFEGIPHTLSAESVPLLPNVLARLDCRTHAIHDAGDHHIILGEVLEHRHDEGSPLLFFNSGYAELG